MKINQCQQNYRVTDNKQKNKINVLASPKDRKFARELGINVNDVTGSERMGRVVEKDIKEFVSSRISQSIDELKLGNFFNDRTTDLITNARGVIFFLSPVNESVKELLNSSISDISASS